MMMRRRIRLTPDTVKDFVAAACRCSFDVDIAYNRYTVDAKSIVGVLGLDFRQVLTVTCNGYDEKFDEYLRQMAVAS